MSEEIQNIPTSKLRLDAQNPRLPEHLPKDHDTILSYIASNTAIEELMSAIGENDFFPGEPVIAYKDETSDDYIVIEGNRRLTAVLLLNDLSPIKKPSGRMREIVDSARYRPTEIPVVIKADRGSVMPYLGYRHITGIKEWDPLSKARYIQQIFNGTQDQEKTIDRYREAGRTIGSRSDHIKRNLDALAVYRLMEKEDFFDIDGLGEGTVKFGVLFTALADKRIGAFAGVRELNADEEYIENHPILDASRLNKAHIEYLSKWLYEKDAESGATVIGESRNLRKLSDIVDSDEATTALMSGSTLDYAYRKTEGAQREFQETLYHINELANAALGMTGNIEWNDEAFNVSKEIHQTMTQIGLALKSKRSSQDNVFG